MICRIYPLLQISLVWKNHRMDFDKILDAFSQIHLPTFHQFLSNSDN